MTTFLAIIGLGVFCLVFEILNLRKLIIPFSVAGLTAILGLVFNDIEIPFTSLNNMMVTDAFSKAFSVLFIVLTIFLIMLGHHFYKNKQSKLSDFISIKIFLLSGAVAMVTFGNLAMFFLGIEVLSIALYILAASDRLNLKSNEAGMKYFLMGSFASAIILFGICLIYGAIGSFDVVDISEMSLSAELPIWFPIGVCLITIGMLFKVAAVPFHFWAPDVYEGSPALTTATMSTLAKVVAMAALFKLLKAMHADVSGDFQLVIIIVSIASMTLGNIMALRQHNVKRMLAFSGVSHAGFMLMTLLNIEDASSNLLFYAFSYALSGIAAFSVIIYVCNHKNSEDIVLFHGLGKTNPTMAIILTASLLSMAGIPIFSGFFAKLFLFNQVIHSGMLFLAIVAVINSIVSIGYYFKLIIVMFAKEPNEVKAQTPNIVFVVAALAFVLNLIIGFYPSLVLGLLA